MKQARFRIFRGAVLLILIPLAAGCTSATTMTPSATVTTTVQGWENWLRLDWTAQARPNGQEIDGYVYNKYGSALYNVRVLAQGLDGSGAVVNQQIAWVPGTVPALQRAYFRIAALPQAERYRVSVWAFDIVQSKSLP